MRHATIALLCACRALLHPLAEASFEPGTRRSAEKLHAFAESANAPRAMDRLQAVAEAPGAARCAFVILSIDIVGSTKLLTNTDRQTLARTIKVLLTQMAELVARFYGHVLEYPGDGVIAYFAPPTFIIRADTAVDCAYCIRRLVYDAIIPALEAAGLPPIDVRLGLEAARRRSSS